MKPTLYTLVCIYLATLFCAVAAGISKGPGPSRVRTSTLPTSTPTASLCRKNEVQCCNSTTESNSIAAASVLGRLGLDIPKETVEIGINCTSISDEDVRGGFCDDFILCCHNLYNETLHDGKHAAVGVKCADVGV